MKIKVVLVKGVSNINGKCYPMYSGFLSASELKKIANVPSFPENKKHHQIAYDIANPPVDQWQRPEDEVKVNRIKETYSRNDKVNLMANPVLIGNANPNLDANIKVSISQMTVSDSIGKIHPIPNIYNGIVYCTEDKKPLWILDGQHRIEGLDKSTQKNEPIPFVLLYDEQLYTPPFLAEIFTQVTTGATPMKSLHSEWMKYAFRLDEYENEVEAKSMETVIMLCKEIMLGGETNQFHNKIQFNPYLTQTGYYAFTFNMQEWAKIIASNYYGRLGDLEPIVLAGEVVKVMRAMEMVDIYKDNGSKLLSDSNPHKILAEGFISGFLRYMSANNTKKSVNEWKDFLSDPDRAFNKCDWRLPFVRSSGALSSGNGVPSKTIALECFDVVFNDPTKLNKVKLTDYLNGVEAKIKITSYQKTQAGKKSKNDSYYVIISPTGLNPFDVNAKGIKREIISIESESANCHVVSVMDANVNPPVPLKGATSKSGLDISSFPTSYTIQVETMSYSGDTRRITEIRLDK